MTGLVKLDRKLIKIWQNMSHWLYLQNGVSYNNQQHSTRGRDKHSKTYRAYFHPGLWHFEEVIWTTKVGKYPHLKWLPIYLNLSEFVEASSPITLNFWLDTLGVRDFIKLGSKQCFDRCGLFSRYSHLAGHIFGQE